MYFVRNIVLSFVALFLLYVNLCLGLSCPRKCDETKCKPIDKCKGGIGKDSCSCCPECLKVNGEECGGPWNVLGKCDQGLKCEKKNNGRGIPFNHKGTCKAYPECNVAPTYGRYHKYYCFAGRTLYCLPRDCDSCCIFHLRCPPNHKFIIPQKKCRRRKLENKKKVIINKNTKSKRKH